MFISGLDEHTHRRARAGITPQNPDLVVVQHNLLQLRIKLGERFPQGAIERIDWSVALGGSVFHCAIRSLDHDRSLRQWGFIFLTFLINDTETDQTEMADRPVERLLHQQLERPFCTFVLKSDVLQPFYFVQNSFDRWVRTLHIQAKLLGLINY